MLLLPASGPWRTLRRGQGSHFQRMNELEMIRSDSKSCLLLLALSLTWLGCQKNDGAEEHTAERSPLQELQASLPVQQDANVIVVSFDALRADALGLYGYPRPTSPAIDAFGQASIVFDKAYTVAPVTPTSFASAFTGLLPTRVFHAWDLVYRDTLAQRFADAGYQTAAFLNNIQLTEERHFDTGFAVYEALNVAEEAVVEKSLAWLRENRGGKVFAWIHFISPHSPYDRREMASHLYDESYAGEFVDTTGHKFETDDPREIARIRELYDGEVLYADSLFDQLIAGLNELGFLDNSVIVVTADHGEEFKEHGGFQHDRLTEEHVRVPLIIRHPAVETALRTPVLVSNLDFFPTLLSLAGIEHDVLLDGRDLLHISQDPDWLVGVSMTGGKHRWLSKLKGRYKLIQTCMPETAQRLFDLVDDPGESRDLSQELPSVTRELYRDLGNVLGGEPCAVMRAAVRGVDPTVGLSAENIEILKSLGYLGD